MKKVRPIALLLALIMAFCAFGTTLASAEAAPEIKDVIVDLFTYMDIPDDTAALEAINEIMHPLGVNVKFEWTTSKQYWQDVPLKIASNTPVDLITITDYRIPGFLSNGSLMKIDDLFAEYGKDIPGAFGEEYGWLLDATMTTNGRYYLPTLQQKFANIYALFNKEYVDKYSIDLSAIKSYKDLDPIFELIHEKEPGLKVLIPATTSFACFNSTMLGVDSFEGMGDAIGCLLGDDGNFNVIDIYETEEYANMLNDIRAWYEKGYISTDVLTAGENVDTYWKTGNAFCCIRQHDALNADIHAAAATGQYGTETLSVPLGAQNCIFLRYQNAIPVTAQNPEGAMIFLNQLYTNPDLINAMYHGKKDVDWFINDDGLLEYKPDSSYANNTSGGVMQHFGNFFLATDLATTYKGYSADLEAAMAKANRQRSLGFMFETDNVAVQYTAVKNVIEEYKGLEYGTMDPAVELPNFIQKLKNAGIDDIIAEKQQQLNAWVAAQGK